MDSRKLWTSMCGGVGKTREGKGTNKGGENNMDGQPGT